MASLVDSHIREGFSQCFVLEPLGCILKTCSEGETSGAEHLWCTFLDLSGGTVYWETPSLGMHPSETFAFRMDNEVQATVLESGLPQARTLELCWNTLPIIPCLQKNCAGQDGI